VLHLLKSVGMKFLLTIFLCLILANPVYSYTPFPWSGKWDMKVTSNSGTSTQVPIELEHVGSYVHSLLSDLNMGGPTSGDGTNWEGRWLPASLPEVTKCDYSGEFSLKLTDANHFQGSWWCGIDRMHRKGPSGIEYPPDGSIVATKSGTSTAQGQTSQTGTVPPESCSCDKTKHLVWDGYEGCNCVCENDWESDANGNCRPSFVSLHEQNRTDDIYCPTGGAIQPATSGAAQGGYPDITGIWYLGGPYDEGRPCQVIHNGNALIFINENGGQSGGRFVDSGTVVASDWQGLQGKISDGGKRIDWSNGSWWVRNSQQGNSQRPSLGGCYQDPFTGEITCVDASGNPISSASSQGNPQGPSSGGCYQDPFTGEITCVDASGNPGSSVSGQGNSQGISSGGCYQDPVTGEITCVDSTGTPEDLSAPEKGCTTDPLTGETICID
jgi:hypothetical protein